MGHRFRDFGARLAVPGEVELRGIKPGIRFDKRVVDPFDEFLRHRLAGVADQFGLVVEQIELRGRAGLEEVDHALRLGRKVRFLRSQRTGALNVRCLWRCKQVLLEQVSQSKGAQPDPALLEEIPPRDQLSGLESDFISVAHSYSFAIVSSRFSSTRATIVQGAT